MRTFWIIMLVLVAAGLVYAFRPSGGTTAPAPQPEARALPPIDVNAPPVPSAAPVPVASTPGIPVAKPQADPAPSTPAGATDVVQSVTPGPEVKSNAPVAAPATVSAPPAVPAPTKVETPKVVEAPKVEAAKVEVLKAEAPKVEATKVEAPRVEAAKVEEPKPVQAEPYKKPVELTGEIAPPPTYEDFLKQMAAQDAANDAKAKEIAAAEKSNTASGQSGAATEPAKAVVAAPAGLKIEPQADGSVLVEGRYKMSGEGTREKPYVIAWDHLASAQDDYAPKDGKTEIPPRIKMLDGKWVRVTGYVAFPLMVQSADELLSMMNQWDGCCIGIPPTPYDAVEVRLVTPVSGRDRLTNFGVVQGKFRVEPHTVGGWLVGLYLMDSATLEPKGFGGFAP